MEEVAKRLGIFMDHKSANIIPFTQESVENTTVDSKFTHREKEHLLSKSESVMHHAEQHEEAQYYRKLGDIIKGYQEIILFGPTEAKSELLNILMADSHFSKIKIFVESTDRLSEKEQHLFVRNHFSKH